MKSMRKAPLILWNQVFCPAPTHLQKLNSINGVEVWVKRDDLNHPVIQGNKLRKLKYNIKIALEDDCKQLLTFGGAYSNHLLATAQAAQLCGLVSLGFVRGDELEKQGHKWSQTLLQAQKCGMEFVFINRHEYRQKEHSKTVKTYLENNKLKSYLIPEGGSNKAAVTGVQEILNELKQQNLSPSHIICACGTGGTLAGLVEGAAEQKIKAQIIGVPVLKGAEFLTQDIIKLAPNHAQVQWYLNHDYHAGGYAKNNQQILDFAAKFSLETTIPLDKIYTSKSFYAAFDLIDKGEIKPNSSVLIIHTGGLQGGLNQV